MGLFDFFRKGKEVQKEPIRKPAEGRSGSMPDLQPKADRPAVLSPEYYEIQKGDSLSAIAKRQYGDASQWKLIYEANKDTIKNPDLIYPGQNILIPVKK
jgi:nucleoid-associated protein YgaU